MENSKGQTRLIIAFSTLEKASKFEAAYLKTFDLRLKVLQAINSH